MSLLFADIYEAIRCLRVQKGVCEKDILNYVEDRVGGCLKASNFMKTIRTLQKLVDEGVLRKKGKRFIMQSNSQEDDDESMEDEECDEENGAGDVNDCEGENANDCEDDDEDDEEDEEDDDDDDDEEDEDDDDDDDECDEKDTKPEKQEGEDNKNSSNNEKFILSPNKNGDGSDKKDDNYGNGVQCTKSLDKSDGKNSGRMLNKEARTAIEPKNEVKSKEGETIAFCVRDFIDSLYRPNIDCHDDEKLDKYDDLPQENMDATEKDEPENFPPNKKRRSKAKKGVQSRCSYRSRSPIKKVKAETYYCLKKNGSDEFCFRSASNQYLPEPMDADMDLEIDKDPDVIPVEYETERRRTPAEPQPPHTPRALGSKRGSCSSNFKMEGFCNDNNDKPMKKNTQAKMLQMRVDPSGRKNRLLADEGNNRQEKVKRSSSVEDERSINEEERASVCSFCEKKKLD